MCRCRSQRQQTLLRFNLQPVNPGKPFVERCVGFFLHSDMMFRVTKRLDSDLTGLVHDGSTLHEAAALPGAQEE